MFQLIAAAQDIQLNIGQKAISSDLPGTDTTMADFIGGILSGVMVIAAILVLLFLIWGAIEWILAGGDAGKIQKARDKIVQSVVGIIVLACTIAIFGLLQQFLGIKVLQFAVNSSRNAKVEDLQNRIDANDAGELTRDEQEQLQRDLLNREN